MKFDSVNQHKEIEKCEKGLSLVTFSILCNYIHLFPLTRKILIITKTIKDKD
jgi:hypothetical protein